jgi:hypothetical protein
MDDNLEAPESRQEDSQPEPVKECPKIFLVGIAFLAIFAPVFFLFQNAHHQNRMCSQDFAKGERNDSPVGYYEVLNQIQRTVDESKDTDG